MLAVAASDVTEVWEQSPNFEFVKMHWCYLVLVCHLWSWNGLSLKLMPFDVGWKTQCLDLLTVFIIPPYFGVKLDCLLLDMKDVCASCNLSCVVMLFIFTIMSLNARLFWSIFEVNKSFAEVHVMLVSTIYSPHASQNKTKKKDRMKMVWVSVADLFI